MSTLMGYLELWGVVVVLAFYLFGKLMNEMRLEFAAQYGVQGPEHGEPKPAKVGCGDWLPLPWTQG